MAGKTATAVHPGGQCRGGYEDGSCPLYGTGTVANCMTQGTRWRCTHRVTEAPAPVSRAKPAPPTGKPKRRSVRTG